MLRRHFFLVSAGVILALMVVLGGAKLIFGGKEAPGPGPGGMGKAAAAPGAPKGMGKGGPGGMMMMPAVSLAPATLRTFTDQLEVLGVARGRQSVTITSSTTELVTRVHFRDGQRVAKGAALVDLEASEEDADIIVARATAKQAQRQYERWKQLADKGVAAPAMVEQYQAAYEQAQASLSAAQSRLEDRVIRAPFSGVIGISNIAPGALINPGAAIATLDDLSVIRVDFDVPDRYLSLLKVGQPIVARPDALPGQSFPGRIAIIDSRIDERTRSVKARAEFANAGGELKPGMLIRVGIDRGQRQAVSVPEASIQFVGDTANVFIVQRDGAMARTAQRAVIIGVTQGGFVEVRDGLRAGDQVVADGVSRLQAGQPVRVAGAGGPPPAAQRAAP